MTRISRRVREEAIRIASVRACDDPDSHRSLHSLACVDLDATYAARNLSWAAFAAIPGSLDGELSVWAEAECLLRDGWSPGDPVRLLRGES